MLDYRFRGGRQSHRTVSSCFVLWLRFGSIPLKRWTMNQGVWEIRREYTEHDGSRCSVVSGDSGGTLLLWHLSSLGGDLGVLEEARYWKEMKEM